MQNMYCNDKFAKKVTWNYFTPYVQKVKTSSSKPTSWHNKKLGEFKSKSLLYVKFTGCLPH